MGKVWGEQERAPIGRSFFYTETWRSQKMVINSLSYKGGDLLCLFSQEIMSHNKQRVFNNLGQVGWDTFVCISHKVNKSQ